MRLETCQNVRAAELVKGGMRKKVRHIRKNNVPEDHRKILVDWIKCIRWLNFKVPLFMVIQWLVYITKEVRCLWLEKLMDGMMSIKWDKDFTGDPQWGLIESKMCLL